MENIEEIKAQMKRRQRRSALLYALVPILIIGLGLIIFNEEIKAKTKQYIEVKKEFRQVNDSANAFRDSIAQRRTELDSIELLVEAMQVELLEQREQIRIIKTSNSDTTIERLQEEVEEANQEYQTIQEQLRIDEHDQIVKYYSRPSDEGRIQGLLREFKGRGVKIHEEASKVKYDRQPSNQIMYNSQANEDLVQAIALGMIKEGFELKEVTLMEDSKKPMGYIRIQRNSYLGDKKALTIKDIHKLKLK